jgi:hypothetical protein
MGWWQQELAGRNLPRVHCNFPEFWGRIYFYNESSGQDPVMKWVRARYTGHWCLLLFIMMKVTGRVGAPWYQAVKALVLAICKVSNSAFSVHLFTLKDLLTLYIKCVQYNGRHMVSLDKTPTKDNFSHTVVPLSLCPKYTFNYSRLAHIVSNWMSARWPQWEASSITFKTFCENFVAVHDFWSSLQQFFLKHFQVLGHIE